MRKRLVPLALLVLAAPLAAQEIDPDIKAAGDGALPAGWQARLDRADASLADLKVFPTGTGLHVTTGPAAIFWNPANTARGEYDVAATFTQTKPSRHPEAYGLFVGGRELDGPGQDYLYFLVRQDGRYLIKRRMGDETQTLTPWTEHEAVRRIEGEGSAANALAMRVRDDGIAFLVNGTEVMKLERVPMLNTDGIAGLRVNHNLDVRIEGFEIAPTDGGQ